jgi:3-isopropylmalate/(R)-2-methylmalate dehydratase small subunit
MAKITNIAGTALPVAGNEIDTDRIIPARFMKCVTFDGLGKYAFYDERFDLDGKSKGHVFDLPDYRGGSILLANKNFGCGSSREHAPQALQKYGVTAVIAESFAEIFHGNCTSLGIPAVQVSESDSKELFSIAESDPKAVFELDIAASTITAAGKTFSFTMPESFKNALLSGDWDSTSMLLRNAEMVDKVAGSLLYI